jgi:Carboxypeptidase regulatory-like domain
MIPIRRLPPFLLAVLPLLLARPAAAQGTGAVAGRAVDAADGEAIALSVVRLLSAGDTAGGVTALTDSAGAFRFDTVAEGEYRLRLERIGYTAAPSEAFRVRAGETARRTLSSALQPVSVAAVTAVGSKCYTADRLDEAPELAALWREAAKGAEWRRSFRRQYAFRVDMRMRGIARLRVLRDRRIERDSTIVSHPDSARVREERLRRELGEGEYVRQSSRSLQVRVPDELQLLQESFLATHCLEGDAERDDQGVWTLRFRPVRADRRASDIRGALRVDGESFQVMELQFEYLRRGRPWGEGSLAFAPVETPYGRVHLPLSGRLRGDVGGMIGLLLDDFSGTVEFHDYRDFERVAGGS